MTIKLENHPLLHSIPWAHGYPKNDQNVILQRMIDNNYLGGNIHTIFGGPYWHVSQDGPAEFRSHAFRVRL